MTFFYFVICRLNGLSLKYKLWYVLWLDFRGDAWSTTILSKSKDKCWENLQAFGPTEAELNTPDVVQCLPKKEHLVLYVFYAI